MGAIKIQLGQMYSARLETLGNQISQVKIAVGQQTISQPLPQLPRQVQAGQNVQVSITTDANGKAVLSFFPEQGKAAAPSPQMMKVALTDAQLLNLLSLNKSFQVKPDGSVQAQAAIVSAQGGKTLALKLPGMNGNIKLPEGVASLLKDKQSVDVQLSAKGNKIELQLSVPSKNGTTPLKMNLPLDKLLSAVKDNIAKASNQPVTLDSKSNAPSKAVLGNGQSITLPAKVPQQSTLKLDTVNGRQLTLSAAPPKQSDKAIATVSLDKSAQTTSLKQALAANDAKIAPSTAKTADLTPANKTDAAQIQALKAQSDKALVQAAGDKSMTAKSINNNADTAITQAAINQQTEKLVQQKQALNKLIDPLIRILLPKKLNWSEGLKNLDNLAKQLPPAAQDADGDKPPELKQLLNQLRNSIPDQNTPLNEKTVANMVTGVLNFSPSKVMTSPQATPANAIASALQLLLGAKVAQNEAKVTPQLIQQLTTLLKAQTSGKPEGNAKSVKNMTSQLAQADQSAGSLRQLAGLSANMRTQQLENTEKKLDGNPQLNLSIPLKVDDEIKELHLTINEDEENSEKDNKKVSIWQLSLTFDLADLGRMLVSAKLKEGELSMQLYAEKQGALQQINKFSETLEERLEFHGVKIKNIQSSLGKINAGVGNKKLTSLLQIKV